MIQGCPVTEVIDEVKDSPIGVARQCWPPDRHFNQFRECSIFVRWKKPISDGGLLPDFSKFTLDMSDSTGDILTTSGSAILTLNLLDTSTVSTQFQWISVNNRLEVVDPFGLESFISSHVSQIDEITVSIPPIEVAVVPEANTFVTEVTYESVVLAAGTTSWYQSSGGCEGIFPDVQLCP